MASRALLALALLLLAGIVLAPAALAEAELAGGHDDDGGGFLGVAAALTVSASGGLAVVNRVRRRTVLPLLRGHPRAIKGVQALHKRLAMPLHGGIGVLALAFSVLHGVTAPRTNLLLTGGFVLLAVVSLGGIAVRWIPLRGRARRLAYNLHVRWTLVAISAVALVVGHVGLVGD